MPSPARSRASDVSPSMDQSPRGAYASESNAVSVTKEYVGLAAPRNTAPAYAPSPTRSTSAPPSPNRAHVPDLSPSVDQGPRGEAEVPSESDTVSVTGKQSTLTTQQGTSPGTAEKPKSPIRSLVWTGFKEALKAVEKASDAFPPLKSAVAGVNVILDRVEMVRDNAVVFKVANERLKRLENILREYKDSTPIIRRTIRNCMENLAKEITEQHVFIERKDKQQHGITRCTIEASDDQMKMIGFARKIGDLIDKLLAGVLNTQKGIEELLKDAKFNKLKHVAKAAFNGSHSFNKGCMEGTREAILAKLMTWARDPDASNLYWLTGLAGTGKSAIAYTLCRHLHEENILVYG
ncbi:hypothetical protein EWM64_g10164 [Hericium alpestre]|uniref:Nephrocystin 3-like N-terminal domain-containing protein n=1 Tax=Hericium alpestre TaxID=135208 RepID=A0A4Y9ZJL0_9AGAM|nr:hypothetical protein EWM64_g10164 [Hericium alpestre]